MADVDFTGVSDAEMTEAHATLTDAYSLWIGIREAFWLKGDAEGVVRACDELCEIDWMLGSIEGEQRRREHGRVADRHHRFIRDGDPHLVAGVSA